MNLLNSEWSTSKHNGVTFTNNGDGSFNIAGEHNTNASSYTNSILVPVKIGRKYNLVGKYIAVYKKNNSNSIVINSEKTTKSTFVATEEAVNVCLYVDGRVSSVDCVTKPMLTTDVKATEDNYIPYTGNTGHINSDLAALVKRVEALEGNH